MASTFGRPLLGDASKLDNSTRAERQADLARQRKRRERDRTRREKLISYQLRGQDVATCLYRHYVAPSTGSSLERLLPSIVENNALRGDLEQLAQKAGSEEDLFSIAEPNIEEGGRLPSIDEYPRQYNSDDDMPLDARSDYLLQEPETPTSLSSFASGYQSPVYHDVREETTDSDRLSIQDEERDMHHNNSNASVVSYDTAPSEWLYSTQLPLQSSRYHSRISERAAIPTSRNEHNIMLESEANIFEDSRSAFEQACQKKDAARMLLEHLRIFQGCSEDEHIAELQDHNENFGAQGNEHYRLRDITDIGGARSVLGRSTLLLKSDLTQQKLDPPKLRRLFEGRVDQGSNQPSEPRKICIHESHTNSSDSRMCSTTFDVDSHFGWATSLSAMRKGFSMYFPPPKHLQMSSNLHIRRAENSFAGAFGSGPEGSMRLDVATHLCLGEIPSLDAMLYIYFPKIHNPSTLLTDNEVATFFDEILLKALRGSSASDSMSSFPHSTAAARKKATAGSTEPQMREHVKSGVSALLQYWIHEDTCMTLWENMSKIIEEESANNPDIAKFDGAQIFFTAKNHKHKHRRSSLLKVLREFDEKLRATYDFESIHFLALDIGKEVTTYTSTRRAGFFRRCCVRRATSKLFTDADGRPQNPSKCMCVYNHCGLRDLTNFTATPPKDSLLGMFGVMYAQWYSEVKQKWDATKRFPFAGDNINALAAGKQRWNSLGQVGKGTGNFATTERAYCHSKQRIDIAARPEKEDEVHYPAREEFRLTYQAFTELLAILIEEDEEALSAESEGSFGGILSHSATTPLWLIPSAEYSNFVWAIMNQTCAYLETVLALTGQSPSPEQSRVLLLLVDMLRAFIQATNYPARRSLWLHAKVSRSKKTTEIGAGFSHTMMKYGFCWIKQNIIDWETHHFRKEYRRYILFDQQPLYARFRSRKAEVVDYDDLEAAVQEIINIVRHCTDEAVHRMALQTIVNLILRQFRQDIREIIDAKDTKADFHGRLTEANFRFCLKDLLSTCGSDFHFVGLGRSSKAVQNPNTLLEKFFGDLDQSIPAEISTRQHFHHKPYRRLAWLAQDRLRRTNFIEPRYNSVGGTAFQTFLRLSCLEQHMILPAPSQKCEHLTEKKKADKKTSRPAQRQWIAVQKEAGKGEAVYNRITQCYYSLGGKPSMQEPAMLDPIQGRLLEGTPQQLVEMVRAAAEDCPVH